jgi:queuine tRNA-ribosyltransferase
MNWQGAIISDSGGFQVGSLIKKNPKLGFVNDQGSTFQSKGEKKIVLTPEESIRFQMDLDVDMVIALDDFDAPNASYAEIKRSVERTIHWAERSKQEFLKICKKRKLSLKERPYILGVIQGERHFDLREYCFRELIKIGFDGYGYGGEEKIGGRTVNYDLAKFVAKCAPRDSFLFGLGVGKPEDIVVLTKAGFNLFDCVLPTRDARHKRLYVYNFPSIEKIDLNRKNFYSYFIPDKQKYLLDTQPVSTACDCLLCQNYSRAYLAHLFKIKEITALRLASIHNLRFYSLLMNLLRDQFIQSTGSMEKLRVLTK